MSLIDRRPFELMTINERLRQPCHPVDAIPLMARRDQLEKELTVEIQHLRELYKPWKFYGAVSP